MNQNILEVIVNSIQDIAITNQSNANQVEFCIDLKHNGLSPLANEVAKISKISKKKVRVMLRNHYDNFYINQKQLEAIIVFMQKTNHLPIDGYVFGAITKDKQVDYKALQVVIANLNGKSLTFHKAFDIVKNKHYHLEKLLQYKQIDFVLTSGGFGNPLSNIDFFKNIKAHQKKQILVGGSVDLDVIKNLKKIGFTNFHIGKAARKNHSYNANLSLANINKYKGVIND